MYEKPGKALLVTGAVFAALAIGVFAITKWMYPYSGWLFFGLIAGFLALCAIIAFVQHFKAVEEYELSQTDPEAYERLKLEQRRKLDAQIRENQRQEEERLSKLPACPICGSKKNVKRISSASRAASATAWGLGSAKIGKQYECTHCKHYF